MTGAGALGPWPGSTVLTAQTLAFDILGDLPAGVVGLPPLVQLPRRGLGADSTGHTASLLSSLPIENGPHGWQLADRPGRDLGAAQALTRESLEALAVAGHGWTGPLVVSVRGPWSLAAQLYLARGDRVLSDAGAVRDLAPALAQGLHDHLRDLAVALPGARPIVVLREPALPDVLAGTVPTFSGRGRLPAIDRPDAARILGEVVTAVHDAGAEVVAHGGIRVARRALKVFAAAGARTVGMPAVDLKGSRLEAVAELVEGGTRLWLGLPRLRQDGRPDVGKMARTVAEPWREVGLPVAGLADVVVHHETSAGVAGSDAPVIDSRDLRRGLAATGEVAGALAEMAAG